MKVLIAIFSILLTVVTMFYFFGNSGDILFTDSQPDSVSYDAKYELQIKGGSRKFTLFDFSRHAEIMISRTGNDFTYGHGIDIKILGSDIAKTKVEWVESGVNLQFDSGHILFVPKSSFEGGR